MLPRLRLANVQVTVSPARHVDVRRPGCRRHTSRLVWSQPDGTRLRDASSPTRATRSRTCASSTESRRSRRRARSWTGERPPPAVKEKSCGSFGVASLTTTMLPRLRFVNVQVTVSPGRRRCSTRGCRRRRWRRSGPSRPARSPRASSRSRAATFANVRVFDSVGSESSSSWKLDGREAAAGREGEVLRVVRRRVLDDHDLAPLAVREGAGDGLTGATRDVRDRAAVVAGRAGLVPAAGTVSATRVAGAGRPRSSNVRVFGQRRVGVVVEREARRA